MWQAVLSRVERAAAAVGRDPDTIRLVAVSKTFPPEAIRGAHALGQRAFGENYVQEAIEKMSVLADLSDIEWHLTGPLQSNKAKIAARSFAWIHTVDRMKIAERLSAARDRDLPPLNVCIQVNISGEPSKSGVGPGDALALARNVAALPRIRLRGFMGIAAPPGASTAGSNTAQRSQFHLLHDIFESARAEALGLDTLSMGMSADLEQAIAEGATLVRVGTALFGERR